MMTAVRPFSRKKPLWVLLLGALILFGAFFNSLHPATPHSDARAAAAGPETQSTLDTSTETQRATALRELGVSDWHRVGQRGKGIKVAILDTGFNGYRKFLGKALPETVTAHSFRRDGNLEARDSQHGILCGEVIHTLAPEAELLLANWETDRPETFLAALRWAREQGARIVTCSVIMPNWSDGAGHGTTHEAMAEILGNGSNHGDMLFFASAGNTALRHWQGVFKDNGDHVHAWEKGEVTNAVRPWGGERVSVEIYGRGAAHYELSVNDDTAGTVIGRVASKEARGYRSATIHFTPETSHNYSTQVRLLSGDADEFHLVVLGGNLNHTQQEGSVPFPADGAEVIAVGAVGPDGKRMSYSSCGSESEPLKPDLVAAVPFSSAWRERPFSGTSAASPQAAGLAALVWGRYPEASAARVKSALFEATRGLGGARSEMGRGLIHLPK